MGSASLKSGAPVFGESMGILIVAEILLQVACAYHSYRSGNWQPWLYIILILSGDGQRDLFARGRVPGFNTRARRQQPQRRAQLVDPDRDLRETPSEPQSWLIPPTPSAGSPKN